MTNIVKPRRRTLAADTVYLALVQVNGAAVTQWRPLFPVTGLVYRLAAWLAVLLDQGVIDLVGAVVDLADALYGFGRACAGYHWRRVWPLRCPDVVRVWGLAALVMIDTALWVLLPKPAWAMAA